MARPVFIVDIDGTLANVTELAYRLMKKKGRTKLYDRLFFSAYKWRHRMGAKERGRAGRWYWSAYVRLREAIKNPTFKEELKNAIENGLGQKKLQKIREMTEQGEVMLLTSAPHYLAKLVAEVLEEKGVRVLAFGAHPAVGRKKKDILIAAPSHLLEGPGVIIDNPTAEPQVEEVLREYPHLHVVYVRDEWLGRGKDLPPFELLNVKALVQEAKEKYERVKGLRSSR